MALNKIFKTAIMGLILGISVITFALVGLNANVLNSVTPDGVVTADGRKITRTEFQKIFNNILAQMEQEQGQRPTVEQAVAQGMDTQILQRLANEESTMAVMERLGLRPGLALIGERIKQTRAFFDPVTGQFDPNQFRQLLADNDMTEKSFRQQMSDDVARQHLFSALGAGMKTPTAFAALEAVRATQERQASYFFITAGAVDAVAEPTDEQLAAFIRERGITRPERRALTIVRFSAAEALKTVTVPEADIDRLIDFRLEEQSQPETRTVVQIAAKDDAQAATIAQRLQRGEDPQAIADDLKTTLVRHDNKPKTALPDRKVADAAFSLAAGAVSGAVKGDLGTVVLKVVSITPGQTPSRESLRASAEQEARQRAANARISDMADQLLDAVEKGEDLNAVVQRIGARVQTTPAIARNGSTAEGQMFTGVSQAVIDQAFQAPQGELGDVAQEAEGEFFAVRVDRIDPAETPAVAEVRDTLAPEWRRLELNRRLQAKAAEVAGAIRQGQTLEAAAASVGASVQTISGVSQANAQGMVETHPGQVLSTVLGARKGQVVNGDAAIQPTQAGQGATPRMFIARVEDIRLASVDAAAEITQRAEGSILQAQQQQLAERLDSEARELVNPKVHPDRARSALGVENAPAPDAKAENKAEEK